MDIQLVDFLLGAFFGGGVMSLAFRYFLGQEDEYYVHGQNAGISYILNELLARDELIIKVYEEVDGEECEVEDEKTDIIIERNADREHKDKD